MTAHIIQGNEVARELRIEVEQGVRNLKEQRGITAGLAVVLVGDNPASATYVRNKERACAEAGIFTETFALSGQVLQTEVCSLVGKLNQDSRFHGILVQLPLPTLMDERAVIATIAPDKDVDGLHPVNVGRLLAGQPGFVPCTPAGIQEMLIRKSYPPDGKHVVICGRSDIVGKPLAALLLQKQPGANATVTVCHTATVGLATLTRQADILIAAIGRPAVITGDMIKEGCVVIDVGINRVEDASRQRGYRLVGDVDFDSVVEKAEAITPVPGGVGPMTVAMLVRNTLKAAQQSVNQF